MTLYIGTYTDGPSEGIYRCAFDDISGEFGALTASADATNPSFLRVNQRRRLLYAVNEVSNAAGTGGGSVVTYGVDDAGALALLARQPSDGAAPCYLAVDPEARVALATNYDSGSVAVFGIRPDATVGPPADVIRHSGSGPEPERQSSPHPHSVHLTPDGRCVLVVDLGLDCIVTYAIDHARAALSAYPLGLTYAPAASGPRHACFHPNGHYFYVVNELGSSITVYKYRDIDASLRPLHTISTLPSSWQGDNRGGDVQISADGRMVFVSNRGHDSIAAFEVHDDGATLHLRGHVSSQGRGPRQFALTRSGRHMLVANRDSDWVSAFAIDAQSGGVSPTGQGVQVPSPACIACADWLS